MSTDISAQPNVADQLALIQQELHTLEDAQMRMYEAVVEADDSQLDLLYGHMCRATTDLRRRVAELTAVKQ